MNNRSIRSNKEQIDEFTEHGLEQKYYLYSVTLTYRHRYKCRKKRGGFRKRRYIYIKLPKQGLAINKHMKKFNDGFRKYCKRNQIKLEYLFIYSRHKKKPYYSKKYKRYIYPKSTIERPHFHGIIALSKQTFLDKEIRKYWGRGNIKLKRIEEKSDIYEWANYIKWNIDKSLHNYEVGKKIISRTRKTYYNMHNFRKN